MRTAIALAGLVALGCGLVAQTAAAEPPCGRGWRKHEACGGYVYAPQVYMAPPVYVMPAPVYVQRPPVVVVTPYPIYAPPSLSIGVAIPLR